MNILIINTKYLFLLTWFRNNTYRLCDIIPKTPAHSESRNFYIWEPDPCRTNVLPTRGMINNRSDPTTFAQNPLQFIFVIRFMISRKLFWFSIFVNDNGARVTRIC